MRNKPTLRDCFAVLAAVLLSAVVAGGTKRPVVEIQSGRLRGTTIRDKKLPVPVQAFLGIPYAQPAVGDLRLAAPQPVTPWKGTRDATQHAARCPRDDDLLRKLVSQSPIPKTALSEDCLYLNVYTPDVEGKRDVLVLVHHGGSSPGKTLLDGSVMAAHGDMVVVSIGYRLSSLGFLQRFTGNWPSNLDKLDKQFALEWVQDNIAAFGGDPQRFA